MVLLIIKFIKKKVLSLGGCKSVCSGEGVGPSVSSSFYVFFLSFRQDTSVQIYSAFQISLSKSKAGTQLLSEILYTQDKVTNEWMNKAKAIMPSQHFQSLGHNKQHFFFFFFFCIFYLSQVS